jgi:hypothetical protein
MALMHRGMAQTMLPPEPTVKSPAIAKETVAGGAVASPRRPERACRLSGPWFRLVCQDFARERRGFGLGNTLREFAFRAVRYVVSFRVLRAMYLPAPVGRFTECPPGFTGRFLAHETLRDLAMDPQYELPPDFVGEALAKGDACYGIVAGDHVAAYGWYAHTPTKIARDLWLHFDPRYVYRYNGRTLPPYRGRRLHAISMARTVAAWQAQGYRGLVSYIEVNNLSALKSVYRLGYVNFGRVFILRIFGWPLVLNSPGCVAFRFRVVPARRRRLLARLQRRDWPTPCVDRTAAAHP